MQSFWERKIAATRTKSNLSFPWLSFTKQTNKSKQKLSKREVHWLIWFLSLISPRSPMELLDHQQPTFRIKSRLQKSLNNNHASMSSLRSSVRQRNRRWVSVGLKESSKARKSSSTSIVARKDNSMKIHCYFCNRSISKRKLSQEKWQWSLLKTKNLLSKRNQRWVERPHESPRTIKLCTKSFQNSVNKKTGHRRLAKFLFRAELWKQIIASKVTFGLKSLWIKSW